MKRTLAIVITTILVALLVIPAATVLADQNFHTAMLPISDIDEQDEHTLRNGQVVSIHTEGPVNYLIRLFRLNGALPNTQYDICYEFPNAYPGVMFYDYQFIQTDDNGNGQLHGKWPPDPVAAPPGTELYMKIVFVEGGTPVDYPGYTIMYFGTHAFETEAFEFSWD